MGETKRICPLKTSALNVMTLIVGLLAFDLLTPGRSAAAEDSLDSAAITIRTDKGWYVVDSANFRCFCKLPEGEARRLAVSCEAWRNRLQTMWISRADQKNRWVPKCEVIVHSSRVDYNQALNRAGDSSVGSTRMNFDQGRIVFSRIDVRSDADDWSNAALPHELTHVVLAERFGGHALPRWADEGVAMLSESSEKHLERVTHLREIVGRKQAITMNDLLNMDRLPAASQRDAFYGQSVALTSGLIRKSTPAGFVDFIEDSQKLGTGEALRKNYKIDGVSGLQREWDQWFGEPESLELVRLKIHDGLTPIIASNRRIETLNP